MDNMYLCIDNMQRTSIPRKCSIFSSSKTQLMGGKLGPENNLFNKWKLFSESDFSEATIGCSQLCMCSSVAAPTSMGWFQSDQMTRESIPTSASNLSFVYSNFCHFSRFYQFHFLLESGQQFCTQSETIGFWCYLFPLVLCKSWICMQCNLVVIPMN